MLWAPEPFVVPGARFRECYYWDSLWTVRGLLLSGLRSLAQVRYGGGVRVRRRWLNTDSWCRASSALALCL